MPDYQNLVWTQAKNVAEAKAINRLTAHLDDLPYGLKWIEIPAWRKLRNTDHVPACLAAAWVAVVKEISPMPLQFLALCDTKQLRSVDRKARKLARREEIQRLKCERSKLSRKINKLKRRK